MSHRPLLEVAGCHASAPPEDGVRIEHLVADRGDGDVVVTAYAGTRPAFAEGSPWPS